MSSPAEVAHEAAAFLIQEALPAIGCLHPALAWGPPVLPKERHGTERGRDRRTGRIDSRGPTGLAGPGDARRWKDARGTQAATGTSVGNWCGGLRVWGGRGGSLHSQRAQALGRVSCRVGLRVCCARLPGRSIYPGPLPRLFVAGRAACS